MFRFEKKRKGRVEGLAKVTGKAKYSAEYQLENLAHGVLVGSTIASGKLIGLNTEEAKNIPGVIDVLSYWNKPQIKALDDPDKLKDFALRYKFFHTKEIVFSDQPIALVIAETLEDAVYASTLITAEYEIQNVKVDIENSFAETSLKTDANERGNYETWQNAPVVVSDNYAIEMEVHNPMEMHATIAFWKSPKSLDLYDKSQGVNGVQATMARLFGLDAENINVNSEFVGGGFGSGLLVWFNTVAAAMAAKHLNRPIKVVLTRPQMFTLVGHRPKSWQYVKIGADQTGKLLGILHQSKHSQSKEGWFNENITGISRKVYGFENLKIEIGQSKMNLPSPVWMRGPGDATGTFGVESALDDLCYKINIDPIELRLKNIAPYEMETGNPWASHFLNECIQRGAKEIEWNRRPARPKQLKQGNWFTGYGMAVGLWNANRRRAGASIELDRNGQIIVRTAMTDIGTGTGQAMVNMSHTLLGIPKHKISVELGNSIHPKAVSQGGSWGLSSLSGAVDAAATALKKKLGQYAWDDNNEIDSSKIQLTENGIQLNGNKKSYVTYNEIFSNNNLNTIIVEEYSGPGEERKKYGFVSSAAHFYKVKVNELTGQVKMERMVIVVDAGTIINPQAAANQIIGAGVGGVGMALSEKQDIDLATGRLIGNDLAGYHVAVNADVPLIEVSFINKPDPYINPLGAKGLGEVGLIGSAPTITNAIYNAIGVRFKELPVTPDKVLTNLKQSVS